MDPTYQLAGETNRGNVVYIILQPQTAEKMQERATVVKTKAPIPFSTKRPARAQPGRVAKLLLMNDLTTLHDQDKIKHMPEDTHIHLQPSKDESGMITGHVYTKKANHSQFYKPVPK